jgi:hypothetical protein
MVTIYKITNPSGKVYVGQTNNLKRRKREYKALKCKTQVKLLNSLIKHGYENHIFKVLDEVEKQYADDTEAYYIAVYKSFKEGLNMTEGGRSPMTHKGKTHYKSKKTYQYDKSGNLIKVWDCVTQACEGKPWNHRRLYRAIKKGICAYGYIWSNAELSFKSYNPNKGGRPKKELSALTTEEQTSTD